MSKKASIRFLFATILFFPSFFGYTSLGTGQLIYLIFTTFILVNIILTYGNFNFYFRLKAVLPFIILSVLYWLTLSFNSICGSINIRDYLEPFRPLIYLLYFVSPIIIFHNDLKFVSYLRNLLFVCALLDIIKFFPFFIPILKMYSPFEFGSINYIRVSGSFGFCYNYGYILLFFFSYTLSEKIGLKKKIIYLICLFVLILGTGSRSIIITFFASTFLYLVLFTKGFFRKILYLSLSLLFIFVLYLSLRDVDSPIIESTIGYTERLFLALSGAESDGSLITRQSQFGAVLNNLKQNPLIGSGPLKNVSDPIEILIGYYLSSWGVIGTICYVVLILSFIYYSYKCIKLPDNSITAFSKANFLWVLLLPIAGMSSPLADQVRVFNVFFLIQGVQYSLYITSKNQHCKLYNFPI